MSDQVTYREKPFKDECEEVDEGMREPIPVYFFTGRLFREEQNKPYEPSK